MHGGDIYRNRVELDFSVNVNPLGMAKGVRRALYEAVEDCPRYPDIRQEELKRAIHAMTGAKTEHILCGNGASELFLAIVHAVKPKKIVIPVPSFSGYEKAAKAAGAACIYYEMKRENGFCLDEGVLQCLTEDVDLIFLANPNNPVGNRIGKELLKAIAEHCRKQKIIVALDECFLEFTEDWKSRSFLQKTGRYPNLIVIRAFTKIFAVAGARLGYLVCGNPVLLEKTEEQLPEWNVSVFAQKAGIAASKETEYCEKSVELIRTEREFMMKKLRELELVVYPAEANYVMFYTEHPLAEALLERGILIRDCKDYRGLSDGYYRAAVKRRKENERLLAEIRRILCG